MAKRVLVVDDSNLMRHCIVACLAGAGHSVVGKARDGGEAVALYRELLPEHRHDGRNNARKRRHCSGPRDSGL